MPPDLLRASALLIAFASFTLLYVALVRARYRLAVLREQAVLDEEAHA